MTQYLSPDQVCEMIPGMTKGALAQLRFTGGGPDTASPRREKWSTWSPKSSSGSRAALGPEPRVKPASTPHAPSQADHSLDFNSLAYRDPTADSAIRNMLPGRYQITHESGLRFWIDSDSLRPLLEQCEVRIARRTGRTHLHLKSKNPGTAPTVTGETTAPQATSKKDES